MGQLSGCCGYNCGNDCDSVNNWTVDGALAHYWDSVKDFLDPQAECQDDPDCEDDDLDDLDDIDLDDEDAGDKEEEEKKEKPALRGCL